MSKKKTYLDKRCLVLSRNDLINILSQEKLRYELALMMAHGNVPRAAEISNVSERNFYRKISQYNLDPHQVREDLFYES